MIIYLLMTAIGTIISAFLSWLPVVHTLPSVFGVSLDAIMLQLMGTWYAILNAAPLLQFPWYCLIFYLGFEVSLFVIKLFLGSRTPGK
jgi:hypothetical protein